MLRKTIAVLGLIVSLAGTASGSIEIPLSWHSMTITSLERGGAELQVALDGTGGLSRLSATIRDREIAIPDRCLEGLTRPYLNGLEVRYGQYSSGEEYWMIEIPFDGTESVELGALFQIVIVDDEFRSTHMTIQLDQATWETRSVCRCDD